MSRRERPLFMVVLVLIGASLLACGCARKPDPDQRRLTIGTRVEPRTLNPIAITGAEAHDMAALVFLKLMDEQSDFRTFAPQLAESWSFSDDGLDVTFVLRADAKWSDGTAVTADDVRFTWEVQTDTTVAWPSAGIKSKIRDVEVIDPRTVVFHFSERYLYQLMDANDGVILPKHALARVPRAQLKEAPFGRSPIGNGPYRVARWETGQYLEFDANPHWYGDGPVVYPVVIKFVPDTVTLTAQMRNGEIDMLQYLQPADVAAIRESRADVEIFDVDARRIAFVAWNLARKPFDDPLVRRAMTLAIDRDELIRSVWGGYADPCNSAIIPILWAHNDAIVGLPFDRAAALTSLAARGIKDSDGDGMLEYAGKPWTFELLVGDSQIRIDAATIIQAQLKAIGVKVDVRVLEFGAYGERVLGTDFDAAFVDWRIPTKVDMSSLFSTAAMRPKGYNFVSYSNPRLDALMDEALSAPDMETARPLWLQAQRIVYDDQPYTFICVPREITAIADRFCNLRPDAISFFSNLPDWRVTPDCGD
jgi:peptide/nickel transport system substrate-binding protein